LVARRLPIIRHVSIIRKMADFTIKSALKKLKFPGDQWSPLRVSFTKMTFSQTVKKAFGAVSAHAYIEKQHPQRGAVLFMRQEI